MPELPDLTVYIERLREVAGGARLERVRLASPFVLRTFDPRPSEAEVRRVLGRGRTASSSPAAAPTPRLPQAVPGRRGSPPAGD